MEGLQPKMPDLLYFFKMSFPISLGICFFCNLHVKIATL